MNNIMELEIKAFNDLMALYGDAFTKIKTVGEYVVLETGNLSINELRVPRGVNRIEASNEAQINMSINLRWAWYKYLRCGGLKKIYLPETVDYIGQWAFAWCLDLEEVWWKRNPVSINWTAFSQTKIKLVEPQKDELDNRQYENLVIQGDKSVEPITKTIGEYEKLEGLIIKHIMPNGINTWPI